MRFGRFLKMAAILAMSSFQWIERNPTKSVMGSFLLSLVGPGIEILIDYGINYPTDMAENCKSRLGYEDDHLSSRQLPPSLDQQNRPPISIARILATTIRDDISIVLAFISCVWINANVFQAVRLENYRNFFLQLLCLISHGMLIFTPAGRVLGCAQTYLQIFVRVEKLWHWFQDLILWVWSRFSLVLMILLILGFAFRVGNYLQRHIRTKGIRRVL